MAEPCDEEEPGPGRGHGLQEREQTDVEKSWFKKQRSRGRVKQHVQGVGREED